MTDLQRNTDHQCQCAQCRASRALDVLHALPSLPDDGRAALDTIEAALNELEEKGFARWDAMNDVATAAGLNWMDATQQDIVSTIEQARARAAELEATLASDAADENQWLDAYIDAAARDGETIKKLMARVAELEAAQEWRPVTERPAVTAQYQVALQSGNRRPTADHRAYYEDTGWVGPDVIFWRPIPPLPPAPNVQEPTP